MSMFNRSQGVTIPKGQLHAGLAKGPPNTISHVAEVKQYALQWYDENGTAHPDVWMKIGDTWYIPPNSEAWAAEIKQVKPIFKTQLDAMIAEYGSQDAAPMQDAVDIVAPRIAAVPPAVPPTNVDV